MKNTTLVFANCEQLVQTLKRRNWKEDLEVLHMKNQDLGPLSAIYHSVDSSTFRAFRSRKYWTPSLVFRNFVCTELVGGKFSELLAVRSPSQYRTWAVRLANRLKKEWHRRLVYALDLPRSLKLINLLAKGLCTVAPLWPEQYETIVRSIETERHFGECPRY
jgi:hypothetical protein